MKKSVTCAIEQSNRRERNTQSGNYQLSEAQGKNYKVHYGIEKGCLTPSWHIAEGFLEEVILKGESKSAGNGAREQKSQAKETKEESRCVQVTCEGTESAGFGVRGSSRREKTGVRLILVGCFPVEHFGPRCVTLSLQIT